MFGLTLLTVGWKRISEPVGQVPALPVRMVTVTVTGPPAGRRPGCDGVAFTTTTLAAAVAPNVTVAPAAKLVPVIVTGVAPEAGPLFGETLVTVGTTT